MKLVTVKGMIVSTIEVTTNTYNTYNILKSANKVFLVKSSVKLVLYINDSVRTKRVCKTWVVCKSVKNFGPKKEGEFFYCPL